MSSYEGVIYREFTYYWRGGVGVIPCNQHLVSTALLN